MRERTRIVVVGVGLTAALALSSCESGSRETKVPGPAPVPAGEKRVFFDDFRQGDGEWEPMVGEWGLHDPESPHSRYAPARREFSLSYAGGTNWSNYRVSAQVIIDDDRGGQAGVVGRGWGDHFYFELLLGRGPKGEKQWQIRQRNDHRWTTLASGPFAYELGTPYVLRLSFAGNDLEAAAGQVGQPLGRLGTAKAEADSWMNGRFGLVTYGGAARFSDVAVDGDETTIFLVATNWGPVTLLRDNSSMFNSVKPGAPSKPGGTPPAAGWFVTPIHATLRASDGKVLVTGFGRAAAASCSNGSTTRQNGTTWLLTPSVLDSNSDGASLQVNPISEQNAVIQDVLYCAGHNTLSDGKIFFSAGTKYVDRLPDASPERGLRYARVYDPATNSFRRITTSGGSTHFMKGGQAKTYPGVSGSVRGEKWYPTNLLLPDGKALIFGGFHFSGNSGPGTVGNYSFEVFDPMAWNANNNTNPYTVLTQHEDGSSETPPTRGYSNLFLLPKPVPAGDANGYARGIAISGGRGKVFLFNHEPNNKPPKADGQPDGKDRLHARPRAATNSPPNPNFPNENLEGSSGVLLYDGRLMYTNGGHTGDGSAQLYFYDPYKDNWTDTGPIDTTISRMFGDAVQLPDGKVIVINGFNNSTETNPNSSQKEPGNGSDISNPKGNARRPVLIDPYASPPSAVAQTAWPEPTHRGYHSIALLLKDGRILVGGGKDGTHITGCEKNELRIYTPPYLQGNPTRPTITNITSGQQIPIGGQPFTINYTGTLKGVRGVALMAPGSITHAFDMGQRYVPLTVVSGGGSSGSVTVLPPTNINIAQPGEYLLWVINSAGVPSVGTYVKLTAPPACVFSVDGTRTSYIEAETPSRRDGPFVQQPGDGTSGPFLEVTEGSGSHNTVPDEGKVLWYDLKITQGGDFFLWALARGADPASDSFWASVNANPDIQISGLGTGWNWVPAGTVSLPNGAQTLKIKVREDGAQIDKIVLSKSGTFTPAGVTNAALVCNGPIAPPDPQNPPSAPIDLVADDGEGQATLRWTDTASNEDLFEIDRKLSTEDDSLFMQIATTPANDTDFVDQPPPGAYTYRVRASNGAGDSANSNSDGAVVSPAVGPPPPSGLNARGASATSVTLSWTDNSSNEMGFRIEKKVGGGAFTTLTTKAADSTSHVDGGLTAGTSYAYRVFATGTPESAASAEASVVFFTPMADAYVRSGASAGTNFGTATVLEVKIGTSADTKRNAFLRFALAAVPASVPSAELLLFGHATTAAKATNVHSVADITWIESGTGSITWNTPTPDAGGPTMSATPLSTRNVGITDAWVAWDVGAHVQGQKTAGASAVSLGVKSAVVSDQGQTTFTSREGASNRPTLFIAAP